MDRYIAVTLPVPDAQVAGVLAGPKGPAIYKVKLDTVQAMTDEFLTTFVTPSISKIFGRMFGVVMAKPLLLHCLLVSLTFLQVSAIG